MIPASIAQVDATYLTQVTGWALHRLNADPIGIGIGVSSSIYRLHLDGSGCPATVVAKLPALDPGAAYTGAALRMYRREVGFYRRLAHEAPFRVPKPYHAVVDEGTSQFVVLMEDLGGLRQGDQVQGLAVDDARRAVDGLARWHAKWWGGAENFVADGTTLSLGDPIYPAILPALFAEGWDKCLAQLGLPEAILPIGPRFGAAVGPLLSSLAQGPNTLLHGDYRADNMLFGADGELALLDFQLLATGSGVYDLTYFVTQSLSADDASRHEGELFARWIDGLRSHGVKAVDERTLWDAYRRTALFCLAYPIVASRGMDLTDERSRAMLEAMIGRFDRVVGELGLAALLPP